MSTSQIAIRLKVSEKIAALWRRGFLSTRAMENSLHYVVNGHAFDGVLLTEENARKVGVRMGRGAAAGDARCVRA